jgi:hypothetical protein
VSSVQAAGRPDYLGMRNRIGRIIGQCPGNRRQ